jgi:hypothetical protein
MNKSVSVELKYNNREFGPRIDVFCNIDDEFVIRVYNFLNGKKRLIYSGRVQSNHYYQPWRRFYTNWVFEVWAWDNGLSKIYENYFNINGQRVVFFIETDTIQECQDYVNEILEFCEHKKCFGTIVSKYDFILKQKYAHYRVDYTSQLLDTDLENYYTCYTISKTPAHSNPPLYSKLAQDKYVWDDFIPLNYMTLGLSNKEVARSILTGVDWDDNIKFPTCDSYDIISL